VVPKPANGVEHELARFRELLQELGHEFIGITHVVGVEVVGKAADRPVLQADEGAQRESMLRGPPHLPESPRQARRDSQWDRRTISSTRHPPASLPKKRPEVLSELKGVLEHKGVVTVLGHGVNVQR
jgi:hypothetical protein